MTAKEVKQEIREHRKWMKANGLRILCTMNRLERPEFQANMRLEQLKLSLRDIESKA